MSGGDWRYVAGRDGEDYHFRGCFHEISDDRIVQTFTWEGMPEGVALETLCFEDLGDGPTRLHAQSLVDSFEGRDHGWHRHGDRRRRGLRQTGRPHRRALESAGPASVVREAVSLLHLETSP